MSILHAVCWLGFAVVAVVAGAQDFPTLVDTAAGKLEGTASRSSGTIAWLGIPYAAAPVGRLRWKAPQDAPSWAGVRRAFRYRQACYQSGRDSSEDCLYLNVWRPLRSVGQLPVFVYIHGGSNIDGSGEGDWAIMASRYNVVAVTFNYRLGPMGWFLHPSMRSGDPREDSGNFGTLDQVKALEWIQKNIGQFGGDSGNVTLAGASAGAQNVTYLMHSRLAKDLFKKAILESNYPNIRPVSAAYKSSKQVLLNLLVSDGRVSNVRNAKDYAAAMSPAQTMEYLRSKSAAEITKAYASPAMGPINWGDLFRDDIRGGTGGQPPPLVQSVENRPEFVYAIGDGHVLPKGTSFADFSPGRAYPKPVIIGTTKNENNAWNATWPFNFQEGKPLDALAAEAATASNPAYQRLHRFYAMFSNQDARTLKINYKFATELIDELDTYLGTHVLARNLAACPASLPVYVYRFDWGSDPQKEYRIPFEDAWKFYKGATHTAEFDFFYQVFFSLDSGQQPYQYTAANKPGRVALSEAIRAYLKQFLHNPDGAIKQADGLAVVWQPWTTGSPRFIIFDADYRRIDIRMDDTLTRTPEQLYAAHAEHPNEAVRDFIEYYVLWAWHWNWYPNSSVGHFDTSPGPNFYFDPASP